MRTLYTIILLNTKHLGYVLNFSFNDFVVQAQIWGKRYLNSFFSSKSIYSQICTKNNKILIKIIQ